jgi:TolB protein
MSQLTRSQQRSLQDNDWVFFPRWSPDGQFIAYLSDRATNYPMIWIMRPDGSAQRQLTQVRRGMDASDTFSWSPDGTQIAVTGFAGPTSQIHLIDLARPTTSRIITNEPGGAFDPAWSPDGSLIAYAAREGRNTLIRVMDAASAGPPTTLIQGEWARSPRWSPSGTALAYIAMAGSDFELFVADITVDREGRLGTRRPAQITNRFGVEATSGLSWGQ